MARAPTAKKKSAAQVAAGKKWAAAGRAGAKKARAKRGGKPTKAQHQVALKWAAAGRASQAAAKAGKKPPVTAKKAALPLTQYMGTPILWLPGCNDDLPTCSAVAVANHLMAATGITATDTEIMLLHKLAGGNDGASIASVLEAASQDGLAGRRLARYWLTDEIEPGLVVGIQTRLGYHAVLSHPYGMISWGLLLPHSGDPEESWGLEWEGSDGET